MSMWIVPVLCFWVSQLILSTRGLSRSHREKDSFFFTLYAIGFWASWLVLAAMVPVALIFAW